MTTRHRYQGVFVANAVLAVHDARVAIYGVADRLKAVASRTRVDTITEMGEQFGEQYTWACHVHQGTHTRIGTCTRMGLNTAATTGKAIAMQHAH